MDIDLRDAVSTIRDVSAGARQRRGLIAGLWAAGREWVSLVVSVLGVRLGRSPRITDGPTGPKAPRSPIMLADILRHAWRRVVARPSASLLAAGMLGVGIALTTAMFTIVDALLLRPLPFKDPARLALVMTRQGNSGRLVSSPQLLRAWKDSGIFEAVEGASFRGATAGTALIDTGGDVVMRSGARVSSGLFAMLGVQPIRGRTFLPEEGRAGSEDRVLLSETVWRTLFGGSADLVGKSVQIDGRPHVVVGIMPEDFRFPQWDTVVWRPIDYFAPPPALADMLPGVYARWSKAIPDADVAARATDVMRTADPTLMKANASLSPLVSSNRDEYYKRAVPMLAAGVGLVFLVLCANVSGLLLAQLTMRRREYGVCTALGATRGRLVREAFAESAVVGVVGVIAGVGLGWALVSAARGFLPEAFLLRSLNPVNLDARAIAAASLFGLVATILAGMIPAWIGTAADSSGSLRSLERAGTETRASRLASRSLLVVEIALACMLLSGATLLVRSFINIAGAERGLRTEGVLTAWVQMPVGIKDPTSRQAIAASLEDTVRATPGVDAVASSLGLPPGGGGIHFGDGYRSDVPDSPALNLTVQEYYVRPSFFELYGIPILRGRTFQSGDAENATVIGERLANTFWPGLDPVGRSFSIDKRRFEVVGLARELSLPTLESRNDMPEFYTAFPMVGSQVMLSVRCPSACPSIPVLRRRIEGVHAGLRINDIGALDAQYSAHVARPRAAAALGVVFAIVAVAAAAGGLLSVLTYAVNRRRREFGIRAAIGASPRQIRRLVVRDGLAVAGLGVALGGLAAWALGRAMTAFQYGVTPNDPLTWGIVLAVVLTTTLLASWRPARRAMRFDPVKLLRED